MGFLVLLVTVLVAVIIGQQAHINGLDFYQSFFAVVVGLFVLWILAGVALLAFMHLVFSPRS